MTGWLVLKLRRTVVNHLTVAAVCMVLSAPPVIAQSPAPARAAAKPLNFEVVSIRPSGRPGKFPWNEQPSPDGETWTNVSLQYLVREAYGVQDAKLWSGGPAWLDTQRFDVSAKFDLTETPQPTADERKVALQALLAERFKLKIHREPKEFSAFNLVVAKDGPKFPQSKPESNSGNAVTGQCSVLISRAGVTKRQGCSMAALAELLRYSTGRTVIDKTGLTGAYDYELHWTPEDATPAQALTYSGPSIFTAVQEQLGLKLEPAKAMLDTTVIDSAEMPAEN
jgi:uncharacterized protein (TIGR03435 family)